MMATPRRRPVAMASGQGTEGGTRGSLDRLSGRHANRASLAACPSRDSRLGDAAAVGSLDGCTAASTAANDGCPWRWEGPHRRARGSAWASSR